MHQFKGKVIQYLKILFPLILLVLATIEIRKFVLDLDIQLLRHEVSQIQLSKLVGVLLITIGMIFPMFFYDLVIVKLLGIQIPKKKFIKQALIVNSFSNLIGFGGLVGMMLRTYFYQTDEMSKGRLLKIVASVSLFFLTGISFLSWIVLAGHKDIPLLMNIRWLYLAVIGVGLYLPVLMMIIFIKNKKDSDSFITFRTRFLLIFVSVLEWAAAFLAIWLLASVMNISIPINKFFPIFVVAACAGIVSMIPGGIGSFDLVFIWGTQYVGIQDEKVVVLLLLYRIGYFFIPFIAGAFLFLKDYWDKWNRAWGNLPNGLIQRISHWLLTILVFVSGLILLLSAALPGIIERIKIAEDFISLPIISLSHQLSVATGFVLLGLSRGIQYKVKRAYHLTIVALSMAALFSLSKGFDYEEAIFLLIVAILLRISKARFYRESYVLTWGKMIFDVFIIVLITAMYLLIGYLNLPASKFSIPARFVPYMITDYQDLFYSAIIGLTIAFFILFIGHFAGRAKKWKMESSKDQEEQILEHINKYEGNVLTHLILLHDKYIFWNEKRNVLFSFQIYADKLVVLGDLVGDNSEFPHAIEEFLTVSDLFGYAPVFYEVSKDMLPTLHENGFDFFKLGEEAFVDLDQFSFTGKKMKGARAVKNKFERENYTFTILEPPFHTELLQELKEVSDEWLAGRTEKGFSLGFFNEHYLNKSDMAIMKDPDGKILGFASLMPVYDHNQTISVDLMRFKPDAPSGTMDFIFLSLFQWAQEEGYKHFNLGMAPLSNVGLSRFSFFTEKIAAQIFLHGQFFYHFQGLRNFKEKYAVSWVPKYLAFRKKSSLPITMAQVTLLISKTKAPM
ncbi:bifunctional lysylphosphatidylglycerol flippase/synthetase MprF [Bacillus sp. S/N-304-OC-R1]|uniref:bifunctional lysylphosphatidylglycerol flippase/synthetase MprF n=1 Tax=Bacillus sp. S/N-304-OC-R1 TaxID=2758034 RepID=UPI001C8EAE32|nr:bifunctional lysylphosphatidylglycerol flippase/synthetase MprF [Bacillus sp. S/N-304-OC-R1]MBY0123535.1 bifunctional lysylphosphatidylglycerol flippase/synthetase MprF [Bacillus sp. S/N-304-OC-R1]